jgi:hypothetical protein
MSAYLATEISHADFNDNAWEPIGLYEGVNLYRAAHESEGQLPFRADAELQEPYESIVMALLDAERKPNWAPKLKSTVVHDRISSNSFEYSEYYETPWPFKDREFLLRGTVEYRPDRIVFIAANSEKLHLAQSNHLRANIQVLTFEIIPLSEYSTRVVFTFSGDLGGWIPGFVKTIIQRKWPVRFIQSLRDYLAVNDLAETERYRSLQKVPIYIPEGPGFSGH